MAARVAGKRPDGGRLAHFGGLPRRLPTSCLTYIDAADTAGTSLDRGLERLSNERHHRGGAAHALDSDPRPSNETCAVATCPSDYPQFVPAFCAGLGRLDRRRPALHLACHQLHGGTFPSF